MTLEELQKLKELESLKNERSTIARAGTALVNSIAGLGASADVRAQQNKEIAGYLKATEPEPIKDLKTIDVDGKPVFMDIPNARFEQAYQAPKASGGGSSGTPKSIIEQKSGKKAIVYKDADNVLRNYMNNEPFVTKDGESWIQSYAPMIIKEKDVSGAVTQKEHDRGVDKKTDRTLSHKKGYGDVFAEGGVPTTEEEAKSFLKEVPKTKLEVEKVNVELGTLRRISSILNNPNARKQEISNAIETLKRAAGEKRLSDIESERAEGDKYDTLAQQLEDIYVRRLEGRERQEKILGFRKLTDSMILEKTGTVNRLKTSLNPTGNKRKESTLKNTGMNPETQSTDRKSHWLNLLNGK